MAARGRSGRVPARPHGIARECAVHRRQRSHGGSRSGPLQRRRIHLRIDRHQKVAAWRVGMAEIQGRVESLPLRRNREIAGKRRDSHPGRHRLPAAAAHAAQSRIVLGAPDRPLRNPVRKEHRCDHHARRMHGGSRVGGLHGRRLDLVRRPTIARGSRAHGDANDRGRIVATIARSAEKIPGLDRSTVDDQAHTGGTPDEPARSPGRLHAGPHAESGRAGLGDRAFTQSRRPSLQARRHVRRPRADKAYQSRFLPPDPTTR